MGEELIKNRRGAGYHIGADQAGAADVVRVADGGRQNFRFKPIIVIHIPNVLNQAHAILTLIIQTPNKGGNVAGACLGGQQRLIQTETQGNIHGDMILTQPATGHQTVHG